jgi:hypothetical protein
MMSRVNLNFGGATGTGKSVVDGGFKDNLVRASEG